MKILHNCNHIAVHISNADQSANDLYMIDQVINTVGSLETILVYDVSASEHVYINTFLHGTGLLQVIQVRLHDCKKKHTSAG